MWEDAVELATVIYEATAVFPQDEKYGLVSQLRRAAVSVSSNIAEGAARNTPGEFINFIGIASGSLAELKTQIIISHRVKLLDEVRLKQLLEHIERNARMLHALRSSLTRNKQPVTSN